MDLTPRIEKRGDFQFVQKYFCKLPRKVVYVEHEVHTRRWWQSPKNIGTVAKQTQFKIVQNRAKQYKAVQNNAQ